MTRLGARAVRLPAFAPVLAHRPRRKIAHRRQLRIQKVPLSFQLRKRRLGHGHSHLVVDEQPGSHHNQPRCGTPTYVSCTLSDCRSAGMSLACGTTWAAEPGAKHGRYGVHGGCIHQSWRAGIVPPSELPALRLVGIPDAAPPYDCETHGTGCPAAGAMVPADPCIRDRGVPGSPGVRPPPGVPGSPGVRPPPGVSPPPGVCPPSGAYPPPGGPRAGRAQPGAPAAAAGAAAAWPRQFAQVMVEILAGVRPAGQIVPWATDRVRAQIRQLSPLLVADRRPSIQRIVVSRPVVSVMEMTVVVSLGPRSRALALRFEHVKARPAAPGRPGRPARWLCTAIETG
jgi:Family of unknown function (DUF6459)